MWYKRERERETHTHTHRQTQRHKNRNNKQGDRQTNWVTEKLNKGQYGRHTGTKKPKTE